MDNYGEVALSYLLSNLLLLSPRLSDLRCEMYSFCASHLHTRAPNIVIPFYKKLMTNLKFAFKADITQKGKKVSFFFFNTPLIIQCLVNGLIKGKCKMH